MTTSDLVRGTIIPCLVGLLVLAALNLAVSSVTYYSLKSMSVPVVNLELTVTASKDGEASVKSDRPEKHKGSAIVNGKRVW